MVYANPANVYPETVSGTKLLRISLVNNITEDMTVGRFGRQKLAASLIFK